MFDKDWDELSEEVSYFDNYAEEQQKIKAVDQLIEHITLEDKTEVMKALLKNSLWYDQTAYPGVFVSSWAGQVRYDRQMISGIDSVFDRPTKTFYKRQAKQGNLIVVRRTFNEAIDVAVKDITVAIMDDHDFYYIIVLRSELLDNLCILINKEKAVALDSFYEKEATLNAQLQKLIEPLTNGALKRRLSRLF